MALGCDQKVLLRERRAGMHSPSVLLRQVDLLIPRLQPWDSGRQSDCAAVCFIELIPIVIFTSVSSPKPECGMSI